MEFVLVLTTVVLAAVMAAFIIGILNDRLYAVIMRRPSDPDREYAAEMGQAPAFEKGTRRTFAVAGRWKLRMLRQVENRSRVTRGASIASSLYLPSASSRTEDIVGDDGGIQMLPSWHDDRPRSYELAHSTPPSGDDFRFWEYTEDGFVPVDLPDLDRLSRSMSRVQSHGREGLDDESCVWT